MKKFLTSVAMVLLLAGCTTEFDDSGIKARLDAIETRLTALEGNIQSLQSAIGEGVFVARVQEYADPDTGKTVGVTVTYTNGDVKYFEITPKADYTAPVLGVIKNGAGDLVWAIDGVAIKIDGKEIPVYQTPVFTIDEDGNLLVSIDGSDPVVLGQVQNEGATLVDGIFTDIKVEQDKIVLTLSDGTKVNIPFAEAFKLNIETTEFTFSTLAAIEIPYTVSAKTANTEVNVAGYNPGQFSVEVAADKIVVTPLSLKASGVLLAYADSKIGLTSIVSIVIEAEGLEVVDEPFNAEVDYMAEGESGAVEANVVSNVEFDVKPVDAWIHLVSVKSKAYVITLSLDDNTTGDVRTGTVKLTKKGTDTVIQTIKIGQTAAVVETGVANLSKKQSANSYIVTAPGEYKFKAVKGNSTESVGSVAKVEVLWETYNNAEEVTANSVVASVAFADGFVTFTTPEALKPGNAVIAAKDASDVILWSWHIWVPADAITNLENGVFSTPMMDRNLGALVAATDGAEAPVESFGLTYQWGRKDPFPGPKAANGSSNAVVAGVELSSTDGTGEADECKISLEQSIQNPTLLGHSKNGDWILPADNTLWQDAQKTMYDPCPPGYRVPALEGNTSFFSEDASAAAGWAENAAQYYFAMGNPLAIFPLAGYRDDYGPSSMSHAYDRAVYWSSSASSDAKGAYLNVRAGSSHAKADAGKSRAGSVRCVVFDPSAIVPPTPTGGSSDPGSSVVDLSKDGSANSYLVTKAGDFKFKAVKGNSTESVGTVAKAELLWETENTSTAPEVNPIIAKVGVDGEYITFSTPATLKAGNALIAAKDANDVVLWSWHIWIPATEVAILDGTALCGANIMDRNLGALEAMPATGDPNALAIGLNYQWGRKDPFPGMVSFSENKGAAVAGEAWTAHTELVNTEYTIAHPTEYVHIPEVDDGVWNADDPQDLWNTSENGKTIYDPCPAGYRVPLYDSSLPMWAGSFGADWVIDGDNYRFSFGDVVFPVGGYIDCWTPGYEKTGVRTHVWASKWYDEKRATCMYFRGDKDEKYYSQKFHKAKAGSVRCVAE